MKLGRMIPVAALLALTSFAIAQSDQQRAPKHFHIDFERGSDQNDGLSPGSSWKHAPGDPEAAGRPRNVRLAPGDRVIFAAGVVYRGNIEVTNNGQPNAPIVFEGAAGVPATISGSEPVEALPCNDTIACKSAPPGAVLLKLARGLALGGTIFDSLGPLRLAQSPNPVRDDYPDEPDDFYSVESTQIQDGNVRVPIPVADCHIDCPTEIALWLQSNVVVTRPILTVKNGIAFFDPSGLKFYADRNTRFALRGFQEFLDQPGEYLALSNNRVLVLPRPGAQCCEIALGRGGFKLRNASWVTIRNLTFRYMADGNRYGKGIGIFANSPGSVGITISGNRFLDFDLRNGGGAINLRGVGDLAISNNRISAIRRGSGIRIAGPSEKILIADNRIEKIGRTAIYVSGSRDVKVSGNFIADVRGVHGNGLTAYLGNRDITFSRNTVVDAKQPATYHGNGQAEPFADRILFEENLLFATPDSLGTLISWGKNSRNVTIRRNVLLGGTYGLRPHPDDHGVFVSENIGQPIAPTASISEPAGPKKNDWQNAFSWQAELRKIVNQEERPSTSQLQRLCVKIFGKPSPNRAIGATLTCP